MMPHLLFGKKVLSLGFTLWLLSTTKAVSGSSMRKDVNLAAIFNVHFREEGKPYKCGDIDPQLGTMYMEAVLFALDKINSDPALLPGLKMGTFIYDTCGYTKNLRNILVYAAREGVSGVIGPQYSDDAMMTSVVMDIFGKPVISYSATSTTLHDRSKYGNFYRTVSSDDKQVQVMVDLAKHFKWTYIGILNSEGSYGEKMAFHFQERAEKLGICNPKVFTMPRNPSFYAYIFFLKRILEDPKVKVVYLFLFDTDIRNILQVASEVLGEEVQNLTFVAGDSWGSRVSIIRHTGHVAAGSLTVQPHTEEVPEFRDYFLSLNVSNNKRNPWFREFWEHSFNCTFSGSPHPWSSICSGREKLREGVGYYKDTPVRTVINAVYAYAHAFSQVLEEHCLPKNMTYKTCIKKGIFRTYLIVYRKLQTLKFKEPFGNRTLEFDKFGSMNVDYDLFNVQPKGGGEFQYVKVGHWEGGNVNYTKPVMNDGSDDELNFSPDHNRLLIKDDLILWKGINSSLPVSICSVPCKYNQIFDYKDRSHCCWNCKKCLPNDIIRNNTCSPCHMEYIPDKTLSRCLALPVYHVSLNDSTSFIILSVSAAGLLFTLFVVVVFIKNFNMRAVRASGRELCLNILAGIAVVYLSPILFLMKPTSLVCGAQRFVIGLGFSICYSSLFLKTNRIYRIFTSAQTSVVRPSLVSPKSQVFMAMALSAVQLLLGIVWVQGEPPKIVTGYPRHRQYVIQYCEMNMYTLALNLSYSSILMVISTWFAFKTRNFPKNYNEAKHIGFTMYSSCFTLGVFMPIFFFLDNDERTAKIYLMCAVCEVIATINVIGLFGPKVKLILLPAKAQGIDPNIPTTEFGSIKAGLKFVTLPKMETKRPGHTSYLSDDRRLSIVK